MATYVSRCMSVVLMLSVYVGCVDITAEPGHNVTLICQSPRGSEIYVVEWTRPGLDPDYVFVYRNKKFDRINQHPSFKERVELKDSQMKDGDVSVTLKDVTFNDTGTYECHLAQGRNPIKPISTVHLTVSAGHREDGGDEDGGDKDGGDKGGHVGLAVGLTVVGILLLVAAAVGFMFYRKRSKPTS